MTDDGKFVRGPEVLLLSCKLSDQYPASDSTDSPKTIELTPVAKDFTSLVCWVRFEDLSDRLQRRVRAHHGAATLNLEFTFVFEGGNFIALSTIVDGEHETTCFSSREASLRSE